MPNLKNPISVLDPTFDLFVTIPLYNTIFGASNEILNSFVYGGPTSFLIYGILHGLFSVLVMKQVVSIVRSFVRGNQKKISFNRILLWEMVENWEDLWKMLRIFLFPIRIHNFRSHVFPKRVPYNRRAWKRIALSCLIASLIFGFDVALVVTSSSNFYARSLPMDWNSSGNIPLIVKTNLVAESLSRSLSYSRKYYESFPSIHPRAPSFTWEKFEISEFSFLENIPQFEEMDNLLFRCDTSRSKRWRILCQTKLAGQKHLYILNFDADILYTNLQKNRTANLNEVFDFQVQKYRKAIEKQLNISVTSVISAEDNFRNGISQGECAGYEYKGEDNFTSIMCDPRKPCTAVDPCPKKEDCKFVKKDCQVLRSLTTDTLETSFCQKSYDPLNFSSFAESLERLEFMCDYMGFGLGTNDVLPFLTNIATSDNEKCDIELHNDEGNLINISHRKASNCVETTDIIASIFLHSIQVGRNIDIQDGNYYESIWFRDVEHQVALLPLFFFIVMYFTSLLIKLLMPGKLKENPISSEKKFLAEICGVAGIENLLNVDVPPQEIIYSTIPNDGNTDIPDAHCGYLPGFIFKDIREYYESQDAKEDDPTLSSITEADMKTLRSIDGCVGEDNDTAEAESF